MSVIFKCIYGPELYRIYRLGTKVSPKVTDLQDKKKVVSIDFLYQN